MKQLSIKRVCYFSMHKTQFTKRSFEIKRKEICSTEKQTNFSKKKKSVKSKFQPRSLLKFVNQNGTITKLVNSRTVDTIGKIFISKFLWTNNKKDD